MLTDVCICLSFTCSLPDIGMAAETSASGSTLLQRKYATRCGSVSHIKIIDGGIIIIVIINVQLVPFILHHKFWDVSML
jgi:hypothetical protein